MTPPPLPLQKGEVGHRCGAVLLPKVFSHVVSPQRRALGNRAAASEMVRTPSPTTRGPLLVARLVPRRSGRPCRDGVSLMVMPLSRGDTQFCSEACWVAGSVGVRSLGPLRTGSKRREAVAPAICIQRFYRGLATRLRLMRQDADAQAAAGHRVDVGCGRGEPSSKGPLRWGEERSKGRSPWARPGRDPFAQLTRPSSHHCARHTGGPGGGHHVG